MVYLSGSWERKIKLGRQMKVKIKVLFWSLGLGIGRRKICEWRRRWYHQEGQRLGTGRSETFLLAILNVVCIDAFDRIQELWVLRRGQLVIVSSWGFCQPYIMSCHVVFVTGRVQQQFNAQPLDRYAGTMAVKRGSITNSCDYTEGS